MNIEEMDKLMKNKGKPKYRSNVWVHPKTGDDYLEHIYTDVYPTKDEMKTLMGRKKFELTFTTIKIC